MINVYISTFPHEANTDLGTCDFFRTVSVLQQLDSTNLLIYL